MTQRFLLTYSYEGRDRRTHFDFGWFESEEALIEFVEDNNIEVRDAIEVELARNIDIDYPHEIDLSLEYWRGIVMELYCEICGEKLTLKHYAGMERIRNIAQKKRVEDF